MPPPAGSSAGETVAALVDVLADEPETARIPIVSRADGLLFSRNAERLVRPGQTVIKVAGREPLPHRKPGALLQS